MQFGTTYISSTEFDWEPNSYVKVGLRSKSLILISANKEGLLSLANHLIKLANSDNATILYENWPGDLEDGSIGIELEKIRCDGR